MSAAYAYWRAKLRGEDPDPPQDRTVLPCGFWRLRSGKPLAVWVEPDGERRAVEGFGPDKVSLSPNAMEAIAERGGFGTAVTEDAYRKACDLGYWPDSEGPTRDLMDALRLAANDAMAAVAHIDTKLALYPDYRLTKKLRGEIAALIKRASAALETYERETA